MDSQLTNIGVNAQTLPLVSINLYGFLAVVVSCYQYSTTQANPKLAFTKLDFIQMIDLKRREVSEERGKQGELAEVFGCWCEIVMLENSVA